MAAGRPTNPWKLLERLAEEGATQGVLEEVLDCILHETEGERGFFFRLRARGGFQVLAARSHDREDIPRAESRVSHYAVHRTASTGKTLFVPDCSRDRRYRTEEAREGKRQALSILVLPLRVGEQVRGGIYVDHRFHALRKPSEVEDRLEAWISIAAIVLRMKDRRGIATDAAEDASGREGSPAGDREEADGALRRPASSGPTEGAKKIERFESLVSANPDLQDVFDVLRSLRSENLPILIQGETGTGKSALARAIHDASARHDGPYIVFGCGGVPDSLVESELLGHVKGAFTGAEADREGLFVQADRGTLLLDEVADLSLEAQTKLLRVLEDGKVRALGAKEPVQVDVRIISSTGHGLEKLLRDGLLRRDLYFRLKGVVVELPSLRDRQEDVMLLAGHFLAHHAARDRRPVPRLHDATRARLLEYSWPGNVREVENEMRRLVALGRATIRPENLSPGIRVPGGRAGGRASASAGAVTLKSHVADAEREAILAALRAARGNKSRAAQALGITRKALYRRMGRYKIGPGTADPSPGA